MSTRRPEFATDPATARYYDQRAPEYDEWYLGEGRFADRDRAGWHDELEQLATALGSLAPATTLDVACGTAFLSRHLRGRVVGVDQSRAMVRIARERIRTAAVADALRLPVADRAVERVFAGHFYGHLPDDERQHFLAECRRVGDELVVADTARRRDAPAETWQERVLNDGSSHSVFKRFLVPDELAGEIEGEVLFAGRWFVAARTHGRR